MSGPAEKEDLAWLSSYFSQLVAQARENWIPFEIVEAFLSRGAKKAVDIIYDAVGPVGPPVRPGSGSLFIVDERRLKNWRDDGYDYEPLPNSSSTCYTATLPAGTRPVVVEWSKAQHPPGLQRRAIRLPKIGIPLAHNTGFNPDAGWIWLVHYLFDLTPPSWLPEVMKAGSVPVPPALPVHPTHPTALPKSGSAVAPAPSAVSAPVPPSAASRAPVAAAPSVAQASQRTDESAYAHVEEYVQLTEKELQAQVAAAEALIRRSLALRTGGNGAGAPPSRHGDTVDIEDASSVHSTASWSGDSHTSDIQSDGFNEEASPELTEEGSYDSGADESSGRSYDDMNARDRSDSEEEQQSPAIASHARRSHHGVPLWTMDLQGRMVPLSYSPRPPTSYDSPSSGNLSSPSRRSGLNRSASSGLKLDGLPSPRVDTGHAAVSHGSSPSSMLGGTPRHAMLHADGRLSPTLRELAQMRVSEVLSSQDQESPRDRMPQQQQSPSGVSNVSPVLAAISMDDSRMSSITETLVTANEHPDMIFPVDAVSAPAKPVPVPTAQTAQSTDPYWVVAVDPTSRRLFYHDVNSGASSWVPPPGASVSVAPPPLAATASSPPRAILDQVSTAPAAFVSSTSATSAPVQTEESNVMAGKTSSRRVQIDAQPQVSEPPSSKHHRRKHSKSKKSASRKHRSHRSSSRNHRRRDTSTSSYSETASSSSRSRSGSSDDRRRARRHARRHRSKKSDKHAHRRRHHSKHKKHSRSPSPEPVHAPILAQPLPDASFAEAFPGYVPFGSMPTTGMRAERPDMFQSSSQWLQHHGSPSTPSEDVIDRTLHRPAWQATVPPALPLATADANIFGSPNFRPYPTAGQRFIQSEDNSFMQHEHEASTSPADDSGQWPAPVSRARFGRSNRASASAQQSPKEMSHSPVGETAIARKWRLMMEAREGEEKTDVSDAALVAAGSSRYASPPSPGDDIAIKVHRSPQTSARASSTRGLSADVQAFLSCPLGHMFIARLRGLRFRKLLRTRKYQTLIAQIADTTKAVADCHAGLSDEPVSSSPDQFLDSLLSQLAALKEELASVFVDGGPERIERELALARRAAARVQKGQFLRASKAAMPVETEVSTSIDASSKPPAAARVPMKARQPLGTAAPPDAADSNVSVGSRPAASKVPAAVKKSSTAPKAAAVHQFGSTLAPSACWRVAVEVISARDIVPSSRIAQGPGMVQSDRAGALAHEVVDGRDCFCEVYLAVPQQQGKPTSARAAAVAEDADERKLKVIGKKKVTNIDLCTLTPEWRKKFVLSVPAKLILQALHVACKAQGIPADDALTAMSSMDQLQLLSACDVQLCVDVLDADRFSKDMFLGVITFPAHKLPVSAPVTKWLPLAKRSMKDKVRGDVQLQYVLLPPDAALATQQLQSLMSTPTVPTAASTVQARSSRGVNRIEELAKAKPRHGRAASRGQSADSATDGDAEDLDAANKQAQFLRAQSRRTRIVPPPERVDYSKVQPKTKSRPSKASLSPPHYADGAARTKVSKIQIDLSKAMPEHMDRPRTAAYEASQHVRSASSSRRPDISSDAFRTKAAPTHKPSVSTGDLSSIPIAMLKAQVTPSSKKPSGIPRAAAAAPSVKLHGDSVDVPDAGKWHERLRGGPSKPVKDALHRRRSSDIDPEVLPSGAVEFTSSAWANDELWMQTSGSAINAHASPRSPDVHSRFDEVEKYLREQRIHEAATARQPFSFKDAVARAQPTSVQGVEPYIPLHQARIPARSDTHPARALEGSGLRLPASVGSGDVVAKLDKLTAELQQLQQQRVQRTQVTAAAAPARPRLDPASEAPTFHARTEVAPKEAPAKAVDMDFVALQRVFEEMLSKEEPPNYDDFLKRTSFLPRAPSPPRAALHAVGATAGSPPMMTSPQLPSRIRPPRL